MEIYRNSQSDVALEVRQDAFTTLNGPNKVVALENGREISPG